MKTDKRRSQQAKLGFDRLDERVVPAAFFTAGPGLVAGLNTLANVGTDFTGLNLGGITTVPNLGGFNTGGVVTGTPTGVTTVGSGLIPGLNLGGLGFGTGG